MHIDGYGYSEIKEDEELDEEEELEE